MPYADPEKKRDYDKKRYSKKGGSNRDAKIRRVFFPLRLDEPIVAVAQRMATEAILAGRYSWKSPAEVIRAFIYAGMKRMREEGDENIGHELEALEANKMLNDISRDQRVAQSIFAKAKAVIDALVASDPTDGQQQAKPIAFSVYRGLFEQAEQMSPSYWNDWLRKTLASEFADFHQMYLDGHTVKIDLVPRTAKEEYEEKRRKKPARRK